MNQRRQSDSKTFKVAKWVEILTLVGILFAAYFHLVGKDEAVDQKNADNQRVLRTEIDLRQKILDTDIDRNAKVRHFYEQKAMEEDLSQADKNRLKYINEQLDRQYAEQDRLEELERDLEQQIH